MTWQFRPARPEDAQWLWQLRNTPSVRLASLNTEPIAWHSHQDWLAATLADPAQRLWLAAPRQGAEAIGQLRLDFRTGQCLMSWSLMPEWQGLGLGKSLLCTWCQGIDVELWAQIRLQNHPSNQIARAAGFTCVRQTDILGHWCRAGRTLTDLQTITHWP